MAARIAKRTIAAFWERYERDNVKDMTPDQWGEWVNALPIAEFMAMTDLKHNGE